MKTKIVIEIETKKFPKIYEDEECKGRIVKEAEQEFHDGLKKLIENYLNKDELAERFFDDDTYYQWQPEDWDFNDYNCTIKIDGAELK
jgi:hypothetical protein